MFLQDMAIKHQENQIQRGHNKSIVIFHFLIFDEVWEILLLFDSKTWDSCQGNCEEELPKKPVGRLSADSRPTGKVRVKLTRFILRWDYMSDLRVGVDLLLWSSLGWIGCCSFMAFQSGLNHQFAKILSYHRL